MFAATPVERVREYWNTRPCNVRHSARDPSTRDYYDEVEAKKYRAEPHIPAFAEFERWRGKRVLEVGCGIGTDTVNFARAGAQVTAVDLSEKSLEYAKRRVKLFGCEDRVVFHCANAEELSTVVPLDKYDLIYSFGVIHHSPHPERIMEQLRKYASDETVLKIMVYARASSKVFWAMREEQVKDMGRIDETIAKRSEAEYGCPVTYTYTYAGARRLLCAGGFQATRLWKDHIFVWDVEHYRRGEWVKDAEWAALTDEEIQELADEVGWHLLIEGKVAE